MQLDSGCLRNERNKRSYFRLSYLGKVFSYLETSGKIRQNKPCFIPNLKALFGLYRKIKEFRGKNMIFQTKDQQI